LLAFLPLMAIVLLKTFPLVVGVRMAFSNIDLTRGFKGSEWAGLSKFRELFEMPEFWTVLRNTLAIKLSYLGVVGTLSLILAIALSTIQSARLRNAFVLLFLIPYFIPSAVIADTAAYVLSPTHSFVPLGGWLPLADTKSFRAVVYLLESLKTCGIPVLIALTAIRAYQSRSLSYGLQQASAFYPAIRALIAFVLIQLSTILSTDFELLHKLMNPLVFSVGDTIDTFGYRMELMNLSAGIGSAVWLIQFAVQFVCTLLAYLLVRRWFAHDLFAGVLTSEAAVSSKSSVIGVITASLYSVIVLFVLYCLFVYPFFHGEGGGPALFDLIPARNFIFYIVFYGLTALIAMILNLMLAYPLTVKKLPGRGVYKLLLLYGLSIGGVSSTIYDYLLYQKWYMIDTVYPLLINGSIAIAGVFVLKGVFNARFASLKLQAEQEGQGEMRTFVVLFVPKVWRTLLGLGMLHFAGLWSGYIIPVIYLSDERYEPPITTITKLRDVMDIQHYPETVLQLGAIVSLPLIILFLIWSRFMTAEVFLSMSRRL
jgi:putative aldouronate transport system permease protein